MPSWMAARSRMDEADPNTLMRPVSVGQRIGPRTRDMPSWIAARSRMDEADPNTLMRTSEVMDLVQTRVFRVRLSTPRRNFARNTPTKAGRSWSSAFSWMGN
jgi:hypothetical protein